MWIWGLLLSTLGAFGAYLLRALSLSGALGAVFVGTAMVIGGGWLWFALLGIFFLTSSALSKYKRQAKQSIERDYAKTGQRDFGQVLANGGAGVVFALLYFFVGPYPQFLAGFIGVLATVNADTWATELGFLSRGTTRSIRTGLPVSPGTSGGITAFGTLAAVLGGLCIGLSADIGYWLIEGTVVGSPRGVFTGIGAISGLIGCLLDSYLGATVQRRTQCRVCGKVVEAADHCGKPTEFVGGLPWLNNDLVNFSSSVFGGIVAMLLFGLFTLGHPIGV